jgi:hypothetical protein
LAVDCSSEELARAVPDASVDAAPTVEGTACDTCAREACATERTACAAEPTCGAYLACIARCPLDPSGRPERSCDDGCARLEGRAVDAKRAFDACLASRCVACGAPLDAGAVTPTHPALTQVCPPLDAATFADATACKRCGLEHCCKTWEACGAEPSCGRYRDDCLVPCYAGAGASKCIEGCTEANRLGASLQLPYLACSLHFCGTECGVQRDACDECTLAQCPDELAETNANVDAFLVSQCVDACDNDVQCAVQCFAQRPTGAQVHARLNYCVKSFCPVCQ